MANEEFIKKITSFPGVGKASAEKLIDAGLTSLEAIKAKSEEELGEIVGTRQAKAITAGLEGPSEPVEVKEAKPSKPQPKAEAETKVVEDEEHVARAKPELDDATRRALAVRRAKSESRPRFHRQELQRRTRLDDVWRAPKGGHSKQRRNLAGNPKLVKIGYRGPIEARGLHPSGFEEVLVHTPSQVDDVDPKTQAVRIGGSVGRRKRLQIIEAAQDKGVRVLNRGVGN